MSGIEKKPSGNSLVRMVFVGVSLLFQVGWILLMVFRWSQYSSYVSVILRILSILVVLRLYGKHTNAAMKTSWITLILAMPIMGLSLYLL